ncbi:dTDP-4-dehydrorhamnose reductase [Vallicoccus soli]|uniref:dTDP-4-dehydrorhamnose reductase n=1 Tax=Vallicoccus soli TaxID=2339232 RepID=A0A3A3Z483_9ACTN|nr:dTDP-4-dehydrorhamnose reductase [Vallicoccus soli]RJK95357.1 dTDP-4-dehydrorhamnose reductase [Vallicoccus soli]
MSALRRDPAARRWLVTGAGGMLGRDLQAALAGREVTALTRADLDVTDPAAVEAAVEGHDVVVNCAAWTAVDDAEAAEPAAFAANAVGPALLARACARAGARLVQPSTDYVFAGDATTPYAEDAPVAPRSAYGRTKAAGEWAVRAELPDGHYVVRTAWLYGAHGASFPRTMARLQGQRETLDVVDDQRGQPTWTRDLAERVVAMVDADAPAGTYHATASGETTWHGLAQRVFALLGADPERVRTTTSEAFVRPAPRPAYSVLGHEGWARAGLAPMRAWDEALDEAARTTDLLTPA